MKTLQPANRHDRDQIKAAYQTAAKIVALYGDRYMPVFERMHEELQKAEAAFDLKTLALTVSGI